MENRALGDEIDSIRSFDPESQRSLENLEELTIYPAVEHIGDKDMVSFLDYFPEERTIIFLDEPNRLTEKGGAVEEEYRQSRMHREEKGSRNLPENWASTNSESGRPLSQSLLNSLDRVSLPYSCAIRHRLL